MCKIKILKKNVIVFVNFNSHNDMHIYKNTCAPCCYALLMMMIKILKNKGFTFENLLYIYNSNCTDQLLSKGRFNQPPFFLIQ